MFKKKEEEKLEALSRSLFQPIQGLLVQQNLETISADLIIFK